MISRTYICRLPDSGGSNLDIAVENNPGSQAAPIAGGADKAATPTAATGAYYELRGRSIRFEQRALTGGAANTAFTRRANLGWNLSAYIYGGAAITESPVYLLSNSIVQSLSSTENGGPIIAPATLADPAYGPTIRVVNQANLTERILILHFQIMEQKDDDRAPAGSV